MNNLALKYQTSLEVNVTSIVEKMNQDSTFFGNLLNAPNLQIFLEHEGYFVNDVELNLLDETRKNIKNVINSKMQEMSSKLLEVLTKTAQWCNGTGW